MLPKNIVPSTAPEPKVNKNSLNL